MENLLPPQTTSKIIESMDFTTAIVPLNIVNERNKGYISDH